MHFLSIHKKYYLTLGTMSDIIPYSFAVGLFNVKKVEKIFRENYQEYALRLHPCEHGKEGA